MYLYIDGSNILAGGGKTHLIELLKHGQPKTFGFEEVILYGHQYVLDLIPDYEWLLKRSPSILSYGYVGRLLWQMMGRKRPVDGIWFVPGAGNAPGRYVTMCQNLLPIDWVERKRYFFSLTWLRLVLLGWLHRNAFTKASGVIFLNQYSFQILPESSRKKIALKAFIPHGVSEIFTPQQKENDTNDTMKLIYVSTIDEYKHQWKIAQAVTDLIDEGQSLSIDFIGAANSVSLEKLKPFLSASIQYHDAVPYDELPLWYSRSHVFIFGSTCETFGMVLLEAMACGLPVLCSDRSSMSETLGELAIYFDPLDVESTKRAIVKIYKNQPLFEDLRLKGINYAKEFTWTKTSDETFKFIQNCCFKV